MKTVAVILAAGGSSRLGAPKQFVRIEGDTLVTRTARTCLACRCEGIVVVVGAAGDAVREEIAGLDVEHVANRAWREGISASIRSGVDFVEDRWPDADAILLVLVDQPHVDADLLDRLIDAADTEAVTRVGTRYAGGVGVPAVFKRLHWGALRTLEGDRGARSILESASDDLAVVDSELPEFDIDTPANVAAIAAELPLPGALLSHMQEHSRSLLLSLRGDGSPTAHPMTALVDDGRIVFNTYRKSAKTRNVQRDPRMGVVLLNGYAPTRAEDVSGFCIAGTGSIRETTGMTQRRGHGPTVSKSVRDRVAKRLEAGKRIMLEIAARRVRKIGD